MASEQIIKSAAADDPADFVLSFVDDSQRERAPMEEIWEETENSFLVRPYRDASLSRNTKYPFAGSARDFTRNGRAVLKDPETHQEVMTIVSKIVLALFPEDKFVSSMPVGLEDAFNAAAGDKLLEYVFRLPNHFGVFVNWILSSGVYGKGILEAYWRYEEGEREGRSVEYDPMSGVEQSRFATLPVPVYDDIEYCGIDVRDFFNDPGASVMSKMAGAAKRFRMNAFKAKMLSESGLYDEAKTKEAIEAKKENDALRRKTDDATSMNSDQESHADFIPLIGYEYFGQVPYKHADGAKQRVVTVINGITVRDDPWPRRIPFFDVQITPRLNSFWGIGPAEIIRYDQDFADMLKMMLADASVRTAHPPLVYDRTGDIDVNKLKAFRADLPIAANSPSTDIQQLIYNPPLQHMFGMYGQTKEQMRQATGALGVVQGLGLGVDRASATEAQNTFKQALDRPELFVKVIERDYLPPIAIYTVELYKNTLDSQELAQRIGDSEMANVNITNLMGNFDVRFTGSRVEGTRQESIAAFREIIQMGANPLLFPMVPWPEVIKTFFQKIGANKIAAMVADPQMMAEQMMLQMLITSGGQQMTGNGNGEQPAQSPVGMMPAQSYGGPGGAA